GSWLRSAVCSPRRSTPAYKSPPPSGTALERHPSQLTINHSTVLSSTLAVFYDPVVLAHPPGTGSCGQRAGDIRIGSYVAAAPKCPGRTLSGRSVIGGGLRDARRRCRRLQVARLP